jgi:hypothetical protein
VRDAEFFDAVHAEWAADAPRVVVEFWKLNLPQIHAEVAQLVEQPIRNRQVPGSSPGLGSNLSCREFSIANFLCQSH